MQSVQEIVKPSRETDSKPLETIEKLNQVTEHHYLTLRNIPPGRARELTDEERKILADADRRAKERSGESADPEPKKPASVFDSLPRLNK